MVMMGGTIWLYRSLRIGSFKLGWQRCIIEKSIKKTLLLESW